MDLWVKKMSTQIKIVNAFASCIHYDKEIKQWVKLKEAMVFCLTRHVAKQCKQWFVFVFIQMLMRNAVSKMLKPFHGKHLWNLIELFYRCENTSTKQ